MARGQHLPTSYHSPDYNKSRCLYTVFLLCNTELLFCLWPFINETPTIFKGKWFSYLLFNYCYSENSNVMYQYLWDFQIKLVITFRVSKTGSKWDIFGRTSPLSPFLKQINKLYFFFFFNCKPGLARHIDKNFFANSDE